MLSGLQRLRAVLTKGPEHILWMGHRRASHGAQHLLKAWSSPAVGEAAFLKQLAVPAIRSALQAGGAAVARQVAARHFRERRRPIFPTDPHHPGADADWIDAATRQGTVTSAEAACRRVFNFRGQPPVAFAETIDWFYCPDGNRDWTWDLNRHTFFVTLGRAFAYTGDDRYVSAFREALMDWLTRNPHGLTSPNWTSVLEVASRINTWTWAYHHFLPALDDEARLACLHGLWLHGRFLAANLEYHAPNNHLLLESKALAMCGLLFPEFGDARAWLDHGLAILWREVRRQVRPDGVHGEQATMYHQIIAGELLEMLVLLADNGQKAPADVLEIFRRMLDFEYAVTKPDGEIPLFGDSALGDTNVRYAVCAGGAAFLGPDNWPGARLDEGTAWLVGQKRGARLSSSGGSPPAIASRAFPASGYVIMRHGVGSQAAYLAFDCGPFGYEPVPAHGHADALSIEVYARGRTLVADPGVYSYHSGAEWRTYFRGTASHNTVVVDGLDQSTLAGRWHVVAPARATLREWVTTDRFDYAAGEHDGYARLPQPIRHRRQVFFLKPDYWVIIDQLDGQGQHRFDLRFQLLPEAVVTRKAGLLATRVQYPGGAGLVICPVADAPLDVDVVAGGQDPIRGWVSRYSGEKTPAPQVTYFQTASAPALFVTLLYPCQDPDQASVCLSPLVVHDEACLPLDRGAATAVKIEVNQFVDYLLVDYRPQPAWKTFGPYRTDARLAYVREQALDGAQLENQWHAGTRLDFQ